MNDFGEFHQLAKAYRDGFVYSGEYSPYRRRRHGNSSRGVPGQVIDIKALLNAPAIGWYGPLGGTPKHNPQEERDAPESQQQTDRLAS